MLSIGAIAARLRRFARNSSAIAATEFALILPLLIGLGLGGAETMRFLLIQKHVAKAAELTANMLGSFNAPFTANDEALIYEAMQVVVPHARQDAERLSKPWRDLLVLGVGSIMIEQKAPGCATCGTVARTIWRTGRRTCGEQRYAEDGGDDSVPSTIGVALGNVVFADVSYEYSPIFGAQFLPAGSVKRTVFHQARFLETVTTANASWQCG